MSRRRPGRAAETGKCPGPYWSWACGQEFGKGVVGVTCLCAADWGPQLGGPGGPGVAWCLRAGVLGRDFLKSESWCRLSAGP